MYGERYATTTAGRQQQRVPVRIQQNNGSGDAHPFTAAATLDVRLGGWFDAACCVLSTRDTRRVQQNTANEAQKRTSGDSRSRRAAAMTLRERLSG